MVTLALSGEVNTAKCSCTAGANGYCNHTMGLLYLVDHVIKLEAPTFPKVGTYTETHNSGANLGHRVYIQNLSWVIM